MNYKLDLRTPDCKAASRFIKPSIINSILMIIFLTLLSGSLMGLKQYCNYLQQQLDDLRTKRLELQIAAEPLFRLAGEIELIEARASLIHEISSSSQSFSYYLEHCFSAAPTGVRIARIDIRPERKIIIYGCSRKMQDAALFKKNLDGLSFTKNSFIEAENPDISERCIYQITADLASIGGNDDHY